MSRTYALDTKAAASAGVSNYITETGKYVGKFTLAKAVLSREETEGIELNFTADDGRSANFLTLWTHKANGDQLMSLKVVSAILACLRMRDITPKPITYTDRDGNQQRGEGFPDLCGKPIGVLLQRENFVKNDGSPGYRFNIVAPFDAATELTAGEILARKTQPEQLPKMVAVLRDKQSKPRNGGGHAPATSGGGGSFDDMDDDIPFVSNTMAFDMESRLDRRIRNRA